jgi:hypothetical protein
MRAALGGELDLHAAPVGELAVAVVDLDHVAGVVVGERLIEDTCAEGLGRRTVVSMG